MRVIKFFFLGIIAAGIALLLEVAASSFLSDEKLVVFSLSPLLISSAFIEEIVKFLVILKTASLAGSRALNILNALIIGLGFGFTEIALNIWKMKDYGEIPLFSYLGIIFIHGLTAYIYGRTLNQKGSAYKKVSLAIALNILLHLGYNIVILNM